MSLKGFLTKHSVELLSVAEAIGSVVGLIPGRNQDRAKINDVVDGLKNAAENIARSADAMPDGDIKVDKKLVEAALSAMLPTIIAAVVKELGTTAPINGKASVVEEKPAPVKAARGARGRFEKKK